MDKKQKGEPLGHPDNRGEGAARPPGSGAEGGAGFLGDQRQEKREEREPRKENDIPLDGTVRKEHIQGDTDEKKPGARYAGPVWDGPRLSMESRKREPLIIW